MMLGRNISVWFYRLLLAAFACMVTGFALVMVVRVLPYMTFERATHFLGTKPDVVLDNRVFMVAFYIHITSSILVLLSGVTQFFPVLIQRAPKWHRRMGRMYILLILVLAAPSGLVLAFYANGGLPSKTGFTLQCLVWWGFTFLAWREIVQKNMVPHAEMMIRSMALSLAAMSLRTESYIMYYWFETKPIETYLTVTWLSWVGNWLIAELLIYNGLGIKMIRNTKQTKHPISLN